MLDASIFGFCDLSEAKKLYSLFKKRHLITPTKTSTATPNSSPNERSQDTSPKVDELAERLLCKIFDDIQVKNWKSMNGTIDVNIAIDFIEESLICSSDKQEEPLDIMTFFSIQRNRVEKLCGQVKENFYAKIDNLKQKLKKTAMADTDVAAEIYAIKNAALL